MLIPVVYPPHEGPPSNEPKGPLLPPGFEAPPPPPPPPPPAGAGPAGPGDVPRLLYLLRALWLCAFSVGLVLAGTLVLVAVPQANEALLSLDSGWSQTLALIVAFKLWLLLAWYTCRLLLDRRFKADTLGECSHPGFATALRRWLPRALILIGGLPVSGFFLLQDHERWIGGVLLLVTAGLFVFVVQRRRWLARLPRGSALARWLALDSRAQAIAELSREDRLSGVSRSLILLILVAQWSVLAGLMTWPEATARALGAPALVLLALGSWIVFGAVFLTYLPKVYLRVPLTALPLLLFVLAAPFNDNHIVADPQASAPGVNPPRPGADAWLQQWLRTAGTERPLVLVAVAGGASRAAYWGSASLARLQALGEQQGVNFADHVFAISGTSGGALAAATFVTALDARRAAAQPERCSPWALTRAFTGLDHLATPLGLMLYPDLLQRFIPSAFPSLDRSRGLEDVWERDWARVLQRQCAPKVPGANPWREPFGALPARAGAKGWLPLLSLNTAALGRGQRVYQAHYRLYNGDGLDLFDPSLDLEVDHLSLAQAVHNSARFPYISPAGAVKFKTPHGDSEHDDDGEVWDRLGDGGYVEASATLALVDLLKELEATGMLRDCKPGDDCSQVLDRRRLRLLLLVNAPARTRDWLCRDAPRGADIAPVDAQRRQARSMALPELVAPPAGILASNSARGQDATVELIKKVGGCGQVAELRLPKFKTERDPSMNWMLNPASRARIDAALLEQTQTEDPWGRDAQNQLAVQLQKAKAWLPLMRPAP